VIAHLERARLDEAHLEAASLWGAHLEGANLRGAHLGAYLGVEANLGGVHLEGADLGAAKGLVQDQITRASGDSGTILPQGLTRPEHWRAV
jgi:uncharacterized protein YjbI with pentapeptide repeats